MDTINNNAQFYNNKLFKKIGWEKNQIIIPLFLLVIFLFLLTFFIAQIYPIFFHEEKKTTDQPLITSTPSLIPTKPINQQASLLKRILYVKNNKLYSITPDGQNNLDLSLLLHMDELYPEIIAINKYGTKFFYVQKQNIWTANTDGTQVKKITNNIAIKPDFTILFIGMNDETTKLLYSYNKPDGEGNFKINPYIDYGLHYYNITTGINRFISPVSTFFKFVEFIGERPIFIQTQDDYLYELDLNNDTFIRFSSVPIPNSSHEAYINVGKKTITYSAHRSDSETMPVDFSSSYSQIVSFNFVSGERKNISPAGTYAEYQSLYVSPHYQNLIYGHVIPEGINTKEIETYHYNIETMKTKKLALQKDNNIEVFFVDPLWIDDDTFFYYQPKDLSTFDLMNSNKTNNSRSAWVPHDVYKFDLRSNNKTQFLEDVDYLIHP